ncbi:hypothetical protein H0H92_003691 [Tricholoma furcatifolium]|nr:hypothetical protein H0H92_003691 [Tricholoma furcatifolium]
MAVAQGNAITSPADGTTVSAGSNIVVQFTRYDGLLTPYEIGIAIGLEPCAQNSCPPPADIIGDVLYTGPYKPVLHKHGQMYKDYSVTIPDGISGLAQLNVAHFFLIGHMA